MMKKIFALISALTVIFTSCQKENGDTGDIDASNIVGRWELIDVKLATKSAVIGSVKVSVTIEFTSDGSFAMSQTIGEGRGRDFMGTWTLNEDGILSGKYSDGKTWASSYKAAIIGNTLNLTVHPNGSDTYCYKKL